MFIIPLRRGKRAVIWMPISWRLPEGEPGVSASHDTIPKNLKMGSVCLSDDLFLGFMGNASTPVENFTIIREIIRKKHVQLASLQGPLFSGQGIPGSQRLLLIEHELLPKTWRTVRSRSFFEKLQEDLIRYMWAEKSGISLCYLYQNFQFYHKSFDMELFKH